MQLISKGREEWLRENIFHIYNLVLNQFEMNSIYLKSLWIYLKSECRNACDQDARGRCGPFDPPVQTAPAAALPAAADAPLSTAVAAVSEAATVFTVSADAPAAEEVTIFKKENTCNFSFKSYNI